ncbi:MAG TPA: hypothetical protein PKZ36_01030 [Candidatus Paceibacterota bacterium]|nr:hypothetical protein [Candidatus Paceibacterota bacterium]HPT17973.1 hypothetical protein [Candidatus Paceibacterota bacterium]
MNKELAKAFKKTCYMANEDLPLVVWKRIIKQKKHALKVKLGIFSFLGTTSLVGFIFMFKTLLSDLSQSGFYQYLSMAFSNKDILVTYWKEFAFSITESLPMASTLYSLTLIFIFFLCLRYAMKQIIKGQLTSSFLQARPV